MQTPLGKNCVGLHKYGAQPDHHSYTDKYAPFRLNIGDFMKTWREGSAVSEHATLDYKNWDVSVTGH